jgi:hypothetical protein
VVTGRYEKLKIQDQFRRENWQPIIAGGMAEGEGEGG